MSQLVLDQQYLNLIPSNQFVPQNILYICTYLELGLSITFLLIKSVLVMCCFNSVNVRTIFTGRPAFQSFQKDTLPLLQQNKMVYKFQYQCDADYIGRTIQRLEVKQHVSQEFFKMTLKCYIWVFPVTRIGWPLYIQGQIS